MQAKIVNRVLMAFWLLYMSISALGETGSYKRMAAEFLALLVMACFGWMERNNTINQNVRQASPSTLGERQ